MDFKPHPYQQHALEHMRSNPYSALLLEMGLGKTVICLTLASELLRSGEAKKVLVVAPKRVADATWSAEAAKWNHTCHLRVAKVMGDVRARKIALSSQADIYVINRENVEWLVALYGGSFFPFDFVVIDESTSFKNPRSKRFKALRQVRPLMKRVVILTGTPIPNGLLDLWAQMYLVDMGERLGKSMTAYRDKYFKPGKRNGLVIFNYELMGQKDDGFHGAGIFEQEIYGKIGDVAISMKSEDWLTLPERIDVPVKLKLSDTERKAYQTFERDQVLQLSEEKEITAMNAAGLTNKLLQYANGAIYDSQRVWHEVHNVKLDALEEIWEACNGRPLMVIYNYLHDLERIQARFKHLKHRKINTEQDVADWNAGKIELGILHSGSGHGLNLQGAGVGIAWFGLPWNLEHYQQTNGRLHRQGREEAVTIWQLLVEGTMDEDVMESLEGKGNTQEGMMQAVKARIEKYKTQ